MRSEVSGRRHDLHLAVAVHATRRSYSTEWNELADGDTRRDGPQGSLHLAIVDAVEMERTLRHLDSYAFLTCMPDRHS